jgi:hypothetical protein
MLALISPCVTNQWWAIEGTKMGTIKKPSPRLNLVSSLTDAAQIHRMHNPKNDSIKPACPAQAARNRAALKLSPLLRYTHRDGRPCGGVQRKPMIRARDWEQRRERHERAIEVLTRVANNKHLMDQVIASFEAIERGERSTPYRQILEEAGQHQGRR